jgi:hypothetical protein
LADQGSSYPPLKGDFMTLCPIAIIASCDVCPIVKVCPLKEIIGDAGKKKLKK